MDKLLKLDEACTVMRVSYSKGQRLAKAGEYPFRKVGSAWMIPRSVLFTQLGMEIPKDEEEETA